ncbi:MAG TPA: hypothetical protein VLA91_10040 [Acidimicrobiia bacterium]|nr:hypothetical protein [Acidimicrobiia bacterium]
MYRLAELSDSRRKSIGWGLLGVGFVTLVIAVVWIHYSSFPETHIVDGQEVPLVLDQFDWVPRGWLSKGLAYLASFAASQMLVVGALFVWVLNQKMTWARALFASFVTWIELVLIFGIVPSEWLNFAQTDLDWSSQRVAVAIPTWLILGNEVNLSWAAIKDSISMGYHIVMLAAAAVFTIQLQRMRQGAPLSAEKPEVRSPYGRPLVKGEG